VQIPGPLLMQKKPFWFVVALILCSLVVTPLAGFNANPSPQPQRLTDLIARLESVEEQTAAQQATLDELMARVDALETTAGGASGIVLSDDVTIPRAWESVPASDGVVSYSFDPRWELSGDEPGTLDFWIDDESSLFFAWDWAFDLLIDLHGDEDFFRIFEEDLIWSDENFRMSVVEEGALEFLGEEAHYWDVRAESTDGFASRMLIIFYPCSVRSSCNVSLVRYGEVDDDEGALRDFSSEDWEFLHTFAHGVEFLTEGEVTVAANANLRACPATNCEVVGRLVRGEIIDVVAISEDGYWLQLESGEWIAANMVLDAPLDLPIVQEGEDI